MRVSLAAVVLLALAQRAGVLPSLRGKGRVLLAYAVVEITLPFPLIAGGEQHVASSLAAIIIASVPLIVALMAIRFDHAEARHGHAPGRARDRGWSASWRWSASRSPAAPTSCSGPG